MKVQRRGLLAALFGVTAGAAVAETIVPPREAPTKDNPADYILILQHPGKLSPKAEDHLKKMLSEHPIFAGYGRPVILEEGMELMGMEPLRHSVDLLPGYVLHHPGKLSPKAEACLTESLQDDMCGRVLLLEEGMELFRLRRQG